MELKWRFPASNFGNKKGISSGDSEAFKKSPYASFAREVLQNSIDAQNDKTKPVIVEFNDFEIKTKDIPGIDDLKKAIERCILYWKHKDNYVSEYKMMRDSLDAENIKCLRISDYNTKGLVGVESSKQEKNAFLALCKGSGVSEKGDELSGGSKGVGKNAAFLMSDIKTVLYSTKSCMSLEGESGCYVGSIGVADFVSGYIDEKPKVNTDYTQGTGFFGIDNYNNPMKELFNIDPSYEGREEFGTDIYVLGFTKSDKWENDVINSLLDSFMAAIVKKQLVIKLGDISIDSSSVESIIYNDKIVNKKNLANFVSQYRILNGYEGVMTYDIETEYGNCDLYVLPLTEEEESFATHKCVMVRYPLMKIKEIDLGSGFRVSAMCIIGDNMLGQSLLNIENPQHIDWEPKRIKDKARQKEMYNVLREMKTQISDYVMECLKLGDAEPIDPSGAGEYLPDIDFGKNKSKKNNVTPDDKVSVSKINENITKINKSSQGDADGIEPDIGEVSTDDENDVYYPEGKNQSQGGYSHPGSSTGGKKEGDGVVYKKSKLSGVKYNVISTDKNKGKVRIVFVSPIDYEKCYLQLSLLDDVHKKTKIDIKKITIEGTDIESFDEDGIGPFSIKRSEKTIIDAEVDKKGYFASEVKIICK